MRHLQWPRNILGYFERSAEMADTSMLESNGDSMSRQALRYPRLDHMVGPVRRIKCILSRARKGFYNKYTFMLKEFKKR